VGTRYDSTVSTVRVTRGIAAALLAAAIAVPAAAAGREGTGKTAARVGRPAIVGPARIVMPGVWPEARDLADLASIGRGKAVVFSPDFSAPGNREFYEKLGFAYFEDASWERILGQIKAHNTVNPDRKIEVLVVETHGTNGEGLKVQAGKRRGDQRSYISVGALQERLEDSGVRACVLAACNSGRLLRPVIYKQLNQRSRDPLFLPPTLGVVNSSPEYDPATSGVAVFRRSASYIENSTEGDATELSPLGRAMLGYGPKPAADGSTRFVISDLLIQMLLNDPQVSLSAGVHVTRVTKSGANNARSVELYREFLKHVDEVAARQSRAMRTAAALLR
jgi:hypothetical protein